MSQNEHAAAIAQAAQVILNAKKEVEQILKAPEHNSILLTVGTSLDRSVNQLNFLSGRAVITTQQVEPFPPITNFMGEEIVHPKQISAEDLTPSEVEREKYLQRVEKLYQEIDTIPIDGILNSHTLPEDILVLRGVAKMAGVEEYETAEINVPFVEAIIAGRKAKADGEAQEKKINRELLKQEAITKLEAQIEEIETKGDALDDDLAAAQKELEKAKTAAAKDKLHLKIEGIESEQKAFFELREKLRSELKELTNDAPAD